MRIFLAVMLVGIGIAGAIGVAQVESTQNGSCGAKSGGYVLASGPCRGKRRAPWALPVAFVVGALGVGAGAAVATKR